MAALAFATLLILAVAGQSSASWCVCKDGLGDTVLQRALDYACGAGADCNPIHPNGVCYNPNTVRAHCSYAVNSYFQKKGQSQGTCDFAGAATAVTSDPSTTGCNYPSSASSSGTTPSSGTPSTGTGSTTPSTGTGSTTPSTGTGSTTPSTGTGSTTPSSGTGTTTPTTGSGTTTGTGTGTGSTSTTPYSATPGVLGGIGTGVGPSGQSINTDDSGGIGLMDTSLFSSFLTLFISGLMMLWWG